MKTTIAIVILVLGLMFALPAINGTGGFGPERTQQVTITRTYVDSSSKEQSHYMVGTDKGVFEVDNGLLLGVWNADELYARLREGRKYEITTKGNRVVGFFFQEYPYITAVREL